MTYTLGFLRRQIAAPVCLLLSIGGGTAVRAQSFLGIKGGKKTVIKRLLPPAVNLNHKRIGVAAQAQGGTSKEVATVLKTRVLTAIQRDPNFIVDEKNPETRLSFTVTEFRVEPVTVSDTTTNPPTPCHVFVGRADVSYQAIETRTGVPQDSENLTFSIGKDKPAGAIETAKKGGISALTQRLPTLRKKVACEQYGMLTQSAAADELYEQLVHQMTQRAAPVDEDVEVELPGGRLKELSALALERRWTTLLEQAEQMPKLAKPSDDAARLYLIALAHEAIAYDARREAFELERRRISGIASNAKETEAEEQKFFSSAKGHLEQAAEFYRDAIAGDPGEKEFKKPEGRIEEAVRLYATIDRQRKDYAANLKKSEAAKAARVDSANRAEKSVESATRSAQTPAAGAASAGPNGEVLKLCAAKLDEATIVDFIQNAPNPRFDLSAGALVALKQSCGDAASKYAAAMRARVRPRPAHAAKKAQ